MEKNIDIQIANQGKESVSTCPIFLALIFVFPCQNAISALNPSRILLFDPIPLVFCNIFQVIARQKFRYFDKEKQSKCPKFIGILGMVFLGATNKTKKIIYLVRSF